MSTWNPIVLRRDCDAVTVPYGERVVLSAGGEVEISQRLGSSITVRTEMGTLLRIDGGDADALGLDPGNESPVAVVARSGPFDPDAVTAALRTVFDPEIPINIVDLGLVYSCEILHEPNGDRIVDIKMTLTAPGCGMGEVLVQDVKDKVELVPTIKRANVELVFDPPWNYSMMSEAARLQTGMM